MHNVKRLTAEKRAELRAANEEKAARYRAISATAMERRAARTYDQESLDLARDGVQANPDFAMMSIPASREHLRSEGLSDKFIDYAATNWPAFFGQKVSATA